MPSLTQQHYKAVLDKAPKQSVTRSLWCNSILLCNTAKVILFYCRDILIGFLNDGFLCYIVDGHTADLEEK